MTSETSRKWFALEVTAAPAAADAVEHALNELNVLGTEINHLHRKADDSVTVVGYFDLLPDDEILQDELHHALRIYDLDESAIRFVERREVIEQDWLHEWKKHWKPTVVGRFVIAPPWENVHDDARIVIYIEPNMAFGTGTHETTQLCVKAIEENFVSGHSLMDVGTGTGILSIAAAKLFPRANATFFACDTDTDSITIAKQNAELNGVGPEIDFQVGPISETTPVFDFVCANLTIDVILPILPLLLLKAAKALVLSGILIEQEETIVSALVAEGVKTFSIERLGEWIAITIKK
jgi:ribosomal protein L11 methyltransferase